MPASFAAAFPRLADRVPKTAIAALPTTVSTARLSLPGRDVEIAIKHDNLSSGLYGGNKVRKLEYLLRRALDRGAKRVATFGAAGSNHALATAIHARSVGLDCTCFLAHQARTPKVPATLNMHRRVGTEIVRYGGNVEPVPLFRKYLQNRNTWVIPLGGSCWLGAVGFVEAGLELARQVAEGRIDEPERIYIACGTAGSAAGLALGLAAARLDTVVHAIQVADRPFTGQGKLRRLAEKTRFILNRFDPSFDAPGVQQKLVWREGFLAGGYAKVDEATIAARDLAASQLGLSLETTYTGKAFTAMLSDLASRDGAGRPWLFWNTYNSAALPVGDAKPASLDNVPADFERYYSTTRESTTD
ncbi:MAG: pyridoxal-phosphate dependent enzyme [Proteobacteria bacterium]|nr:pyridoxal-phosphate dependent enzyme [Pseudomonadota bacterium]